MSRARGGDQPAVGRRGIEGVVDDLADQQRRQQVDAGGDEDDGEEAEHHPAIGPGHLPHPTDGAPIDPSALEVARVGSDQRMAPYPSREAWYGCGSETDRGSSAGGAGATQWEGEGSWPAWWAEWWRPRGR